MTWNYSKLNGKICEVFGTQRKFAEAMGISEHSISKKLNGEVGWKQAEIKKACDVLNLKLVDIPIYFFTH